MRSPPDTHTQVSDEEMAAGVIYLMCGVAGSGKTTVAQSLEHRGLTRLSIDELVWRSFGRYGIDYEPEQYQEHQVAAVLDYSFWQRTERQRYKALIEHHGRPWRLLVLDAAPSVLRARLGARRKLFDANAAFPINDHLLDQYLAGFERPREEGETVISL